MGNPLQIFILSFQFWIERISTTGYRILEDKGWPGWCSAKTPWLQVIYPCVISSEGESLANFYFALFKLELEEDFYDRNHLPGLSSLSKPYTQVICPNQRGNPLRFLFLFCILQSGIERILTRGFTRGCGWSGGCSKRDVYNLCLTSPMFTSSIEFAETL